MNELKNQKQNSPMYISFCTQKGGAGKSVFTTLAASWLHYELGFNLNPTVIIYRNGNTYLLSIIYINETSKQASPATYEIQEDENGYFICCNFKRTAIDYDAKSDLLNLSSFGNYMRN